MALTGPSASQPRKPWEGARSAASAPSPFSPPSESGNTVSVIESAGVSDHGAIVNRPQMPIRSYGSPGYNYNNTRSTGYGSGNYNGGMHGSGTYNSPYGMYSSPYGPGNYNGGMHGSGIYNSPYGVGMHGMGMGMGPMAGPGSILNALSDPNNPFEGNNQGLSFWQSMLQKLHWMMIVSGNIVSLITENTQTVHVIASALYAFLDRSGMLAGFVLKLLRMSSKPKLQANTPTQPKPVRNLSIEGPQGAQSSWDKV